MSYIILLLKALVTLGISFDIGNFIPMTKDFYGVGESDIISQLVQSSGNYSYYIKPNGTKSLKIGDKGGIINLQPQELEKNLGLFHVIKHDIRENIENLINKFRVQMGTSTIKKSFTNSDKGSGEKQQEYSYISYYHNYATPAWDLNLEILMKNSVNGYGWDNQDPNKDYSDVFRKFRLPGLDSSKESWSDKRPPIVQIKTGTAFYDEAIKWAKDGFSIDYEDVIQYRGFAGKLNFSFSPAIIFSEPQVQYILDSNGEIKTLKSKTIKLHLLKETKISYTTELDEPISPDEDPEETELMFYTTKMGNYPETITGTLNLSNLSIQKGYTLKDGINAIIEKVPSWNDMNFARDMANWELSKVCDKIIEGSINITIDCACYYGIDLSKRIQINNIIDPINIESITYNFSNFLTTINVKNNRYYHRTVDYPYHGE